MQFRIKEDLPDLLRESFSRLKKSLRQRNKALEKEWQQSRKALQATHDAWLQRCEGQQVLQGKLSACEDVLEEKQPSWRILRSV